MKTKHILLASALLLAVLPPAFAQVQENLDLGAVLGGTNAYNSTAGATNSAAQTNSTNKGVLCQLHQLSSSGTATITFAIQSFDAASGVWDSLITSSRKTLRDAVRTRRSRATAAATEDPVVRESMKYIPSGSAASTDSITRRSAVAREPM